MNFGNFVSFDCPIISELNEIPYKKEQSPRLSIVTFGPGLS